MIDKRGLTTPTPDRQQNPVHSQTLRQSRLHPFVRSVAAPALYFARAALRDAELRTPRPEGPPHGHSAGANGLRILIVGSGAASGIGVRTHELALPGALARALSSLTGRGVDVDLVTEHRLPLLRIPDAIRESRPASYDGIVVISGADEALALLPQATWRRRLVRMLSELRALAGPEQPIVVTGVSATHRARETPGWVAHLAGIHAVELDRVTRKTCMISPNVHFLPLALAASLDGFRTAADQYTMWAQQIAAALVADLSAIDPVKSGWEVDDARRQASVDQLELAAAATDPRLHHIVQMARHALGTENALFTVLDRDFQLHLARSSSPRSQLLPDDAPCRTTPSSALTQVPSSDSFSQHAILQRGGLIVEDASNDDRFRNNRLVTGTPRIRFYAGFPVRSPSGERVGTICVFDSSTRSIDTVDSALLRQFAHLIQNELWRHTTTTTTPGPLHRALTGLGPGRLLWGWVRSSKKSVRRPRIRRSEIDKEGD